MASSKHDAVYGRRDSVPDPLRNAPLPTTRKTPGGIEYELPTRRELELYSMRIETSPNNNSTVIPLQEFTIPIENFLPPSGPYFDEFVLEKQFGEQMFDVYTDRQLSKCIVCWHPKHLESHRRCKQQCRVCGTKDHKGKACTRIYARYSWWKQRSHTPTRDIRLRPGIRELVYLVKAGILLSITKVIQPIRINGTHPLIKEIYRGMAPPQYTPGTITWPVRNTTQRRESRPAQQKEAGSGPAQGATSALYPALAVPDMIGTLVKNSIHGDTHHSATNDSQVPEPTTSTSSPSTEELSAKVEEQAGKIGRLMKELDNAQEALVAKSAALAEKDARIAELEGTAGTSGRKRVRFQV
ncbi:hypothetical protein PTMSG1_09715 [Pyrenophora teres f. maculata]|nr:hypothetical protein PTMSG1_09715 [Pyrenophora teres f. maculata]